MSSSSNSGSIPRCPVIFDGSNYLQWLLHMRLHFRGLRLWDFLTGMLPCPPRPVTPVCPVIPDTASEGDKKKLQEDYEDQLASFDSQFAVYKTWLDEDARAAIVLVASMHERVNAEIVDLETSQLMWTFLCQRYEPSGQTMFLAATHREQSLRHGDSTVDEFYDQMSAMWRQIDSFGVKLSPDTCASCKSQGSHLEIRRLYDYLTRLRHEFEPVRAQLLARHPCVSIIETLIVVRTEELRLRSAGLLTLSSPSPAAPSALATASLSAPPSSGSGGRTALHCAYCGKDGHLEDFCYKKRRSVVEVGVFAGYFFWYWRISEEHYQF